MLFIRKYTLKRKVVHAAKKGQTELDDLPREANDDIEKVMAAADPDDKDLGPNSNADTKVNVTPRGSVSEVTALPKT